jgi:hypothetical protein
MARKLKVFRTAAGFHDAYVAASSRKAALAAWGSDADLFARGLAEEVTDAALTREPLAHPGEVIRRSRGSAEEQLAALPMAAAKRASRPAKAEKSDPVRRPDRTPLTAAERALEEAERDHRAALRALAQRQAALDREKAAAERAYAQTRDELESRKVAVEELYDRAMERWRES